MNPFCFRFCFRAVVLIPLAGLCGCLGSSGSETAGSSPIVLTDATAGAGLDFKHSTGASGAHYYVETMIGGCAFVDYNDDDWPDIFLVQGGALPGYSRPGPWRHALYRNSRDGTFADVTEQAGIGESRYGVGCCTGDFDGDGDTDVFVTGLEENCLYRNNGDGTFTNVAKQAGIVGRSLCTSAAFLDVDRDGWLDLFVCRYMDYSLEENPRCKDSLGRPVYCTPYVYEGTHSLLYRNNGDGTFADVTERAGIAGAIGRALGVACADYDGDGWVDIFVASDLTANFLFVNQGDGTFREEGAIAGVAYADHGAAQASMGVDCGDYNSDGHPDLVITNFENEPNVLYRNNGSGVFAEESLRSGLGSASLRYLGWGVQLVDLDRDGLQDLFVVNGHVDDYADERGVEMGYAQPCRMYRNRGNGAFSDDSRNGGPFFSRRQVARGAAFGDYDNDGDSDVLVACNNQPAILLRNDTDPGGLWVRLKLVGSGCNREALGSRVQVKAGSLTQTRYLCSGTSYLSDQDRRLLFGIGEHRSAMVKIRWPCGALQELEVRPGETVTVAETACRSDALERRSGARGGHREPDLEGG